MRRPLRSRSPGVYCASQSGRPFGLRSCRFQVTRHAPTAHHLLQTRQATTPPSRLGCGYPSCSSYSRRVRPGPGDATYDAVLSGCAACHEVSCPGPLSVIEGLARGK